MASVDTTSGEARLVWKWLRSNYTELSHSETLEGRWWCGRWITDVWFIVENIRTGWKHLRWLFWCSNRGKDTDFLRLSGKVRKGLNTQKVSFEQRKIDQNKMYFFSLQTVQYCDMLQFLIVYFFRNVLCIFECDFWNMAVVTFRADVQSTFCNDKTRCLTVIHTLISGCDTSASRGLTPYSQGTTPVNVPDLFSSSPSSWFHVFLQPRPEYRCQEQNPLAETFRHEVESIVSDVYTVNLCPTSPATRKEDAS